ncbi:MAG: CDP-archaeol synthase [Ruminococcus sp.]|uniref:CDP-archaeol synthase n=1 Tax=Ruminococcus sp. TaxID=41978 RepID=UPI0025F4F9A4|nr:CDP-archaeol synthase [Ruminococcus sp.]MBR5682822.1 CDP-archaeol synthase [Ruminococcus sp.]
MNILTEITQIYATLASVIIAGVLNMIFVKLPICEELKKPMDCGKCLRDGKRLFGDNKTWKGFLGMIFLGGASQVIWGAVCSAVPPLEAKNQLIAVHGNSFAPNLGAGLLFGLAYAVFELPNSFIKRRAGIMAGKTDKGLKGMIFYVIDQIDSLLGVVLCLSLLCPVSFGQYWLYILVGFFTHSAVNLILYALRIRRNI